MYIEGAPAAILTHTQLILFGRSMPAVHPLLTWVITFGILPLRLFSLFLPSSNEQFGAHVRNIIIIILFFKTICKSVSHRAQSRFSTVSSASAIEAFTSTHTPNGIRTRNFSGVILYVCRTALPARFIFHLSLYLQCLSWTATHASERRFSWYKEFESGPVSNCRTRLKLRERRYPVIYCDILWYPMPPFRLFVCSNTLIYLLIMYLRIP